MEIRMAHLEGAYQQVADRLNGIDNRIDGVYREIGDLRRDMNQRFIWLTGIVMTSWVTTFLAVLLHR